MMVRLPCDRVETFSSTCGTLPVWGAADQMERCRRCPTRCSAQRMCAKLDVYIQQRELEHSRMHSQPGQPRRGGGRRVGADGGDTPRAAPPASAPDARA